MNQLVAVIFLSALLMFNAAAEDPELDCRVKDRNEERYQKA